MRPILRGLPVLIAAGCHSSAPANPAPAPADPAAVTVHEVLTTPALVGRLVRVTGRCLGYAEPLLAKGSPPRTRSDWQLEDGGEALWVTGPFPEGCTATTPANGTSQVRGVVAHDTLLALGGGAPVARQYLVGQR